MSTRNRTIGWSCVAGMAAVVGMAARSPATAQDSDNLTVEVSDCAELASAEARLACFDAQVEAARRARPGSDERRGAAAEVPSTGVPAAAPSERAAPAEVRREPARTAEPFGLRTEESDAASSEIVARVAELRETVPNSYVITLDNGQVWRQTRPLAYPLWQGLEVRIYKARWGYRMTNRTLRGFITVERVR